MQSNRHAAAAPRRHTHHRDRDHNLLFVQQTTGSHAWQQLHGTRADATMHSPAHTDTAAGMLTRPNRRTRDPRPLGGQNTRLPWHAQKAVPWEAAAGTSRNAIAEPLCMVLPRLGGGSATSRWPWRSDPRVSTAKARIRPLASRDTARRRADPAPNRRRQARLPDASNWRQTG